MEPKEFIDQVRSRQGDGAVITINIDAACGCDPGNYAPDYSIDYSDDFGSATEGDCEYDPFYEGAIELQTWDSSGGFTRCNIRPAGILQTVKNRLDTKVDLFALETFRRNHVNPVYLWPVQLEST